MKERTTEMSKKEKSSDLIKPESNFTKKLDMIKMELVLFIIFNSRKLCILNLFYYL